MIGSRLRNAGSPVSVRTSRRYTLHMSCPTCGGDEREPLAPTYWRCISTVYEDAWQIGPDHSTPPHLGITRPYQYQAARPCGEEYHETGFGSVNFGLCKCNTGAIGLCSADSEPVCGYHSSLVDGSRLCHQHGREYERKAAQITAQSRVEAFVASLKSRVEAFGSGLAHTAQGVDKLLALALAPTSEFVQPVIPVNLDFSGSRTSAADIIGQFQEWLAEAVRENCSADDLRDGISIERGKPSQWGIESHLMKRFVAAGRLTGGSRLTHKSAKQGLLGQKEVRIGEMTGWLIRIGGHGSSGAYGSPSQPDLVVLQDGMIAEITHESTTINSRTKRQPLSFEAIRVMHDKGFLRTEGIASQLRGLL